MSLLLLALLAAPPTGTLAALVQRCAEATGEPAPSGLRVFLDPAGLATAVDVPAEPSKLERCLQDGLLPIPLAAPGVLAIAWPDARRPQPYPPAAGPLPPWVTMPPGWRCAATVDDATPPPHACVSGDGRRIYFPKEAWDYNKAVLRPASYPVLDDLAALLAAVPGIEQVEIANHEAARREAYGMKLSQRRADVLREYLRAKGTEADRLIGVGYGADRPIADPRIPANAKKNLRTELHIRRWGP